MLYEVITERVARETAALREALLRLGDELPAGEGIPTDEPAEAIGAQDASALVDFGGPIPDQNF